jgi:hypothetical protein
MTQERKLSALPFIAAPARRAFWLVPVAVAALCLSVSTSAWAETKNFDLSGFDGVSAAEGIHVIVTAGDEFEVVAESDERKQLKRLLLDVRRGTLRARMDNKVFSLTRTKGWKVTVRVTMPNLIQVETSSGAELVADVMSGSALELESSSGSSLRIDAIEGGMISTDVSSGANVRVGSGTCTSLSADLKSGSSLDMENLQCANVEINANSGSNASVYADKLIDADASSGASIRVYGAHEDIEIESSSGGGIVFP